MRRGLVVATALAGLCGMADRASAQVIYYSTPYYYNSPFNPTVRTYSTPVMYSTYTSPIVVPTRFVYPPFGTQAYTYPPLGASTAAATTATTTDGAKKAETTTGKGATSGTTEGARAGIQAFVDAYRTDEPRRYMTAFLNRRK